MATFIDIINKTLERVDEEVTNPDEQGLSIIKDGINQAYYILKTSLDENTGAKTVSFSKEIKLTPDMLRVIKLNHEYLGYLNESEYEKNGDILYIYNTDLEDGEGDLTITYTIYPTALSANTDTINLKDGLIDALTAYAAYRYMLSKKKYSSAQLLLEEFKTYFGTGTTA